MNRLLCMNRYYLVGMFRDDLNIRKQEILHLQENLFTSAIGLDFFVNI